jgi:hypothetical protein
MRRLTLCFVLAVVLLAQGAMAPPARAQDEQLSADVRLFTVLTAINLAGFDDGLGSPSDSPVRTSAAGCFAQVSPLLSR